ncbi:MBL fold metallo-hydrolase [Cohnella cholangitidis]|uniref:MBL fold metallo-hydrolase n=1 Tax=Cohnella cholangitidis TaxID=2598458 RepID=A0A7G5BS71_9BACL|nr:MBL fold metallo-hydrolase [Cohnella cholangitidis]QMV39805.1 MBL fold metallo-hydrolase [Cohnella cholangitidis]
MTYSPQETVELLLMSAGYCLHPEFVTLRGGSIRSAAYPAGFVCIRHPSRGWILFDTGYSSRFLELTKSLPYSLYRWLTPVRLQEENTAVRQLVKLGIKAEDVRYVILSHFHADHIGGARDFPYARFLYPQASYEAVRTLGPVRATRAGFIAGLLPDGFAEIGQPIEREGKSVSLPDGMPFNVGLDIFGDGSLIAIQLPGHAAGQIGLLLRTANARVLLCADAAWSSRAIRENRPPHPVAGFVMSDRSAYRDSFERLRRWQAADPGLIIVPSHCREFFDIDSKEVRRL